MIILHHSYNDLCFPFLTKKSKRGVEPKNVTKANTVQPKKMGKSMFGFEDLNISSFRIRNSIKGKIHCYFSISNAYKETIKITIL